MPVSKFKAEIARLLRDNRYIQDFAVLDDGKHGVLRVYLKYHGDAPVIHEVIVASDLHFARQVRELDIEVPVPGEWVGHRRVTLQLRLTLTPDSEDENDGSGGTA